MTCVDAKRQRCSTMPAYTISKVLNDDYTSSLLASAPPLFDENLLEEILLRLPPKPSSLLRASLVCRRWRDILSDPEFLKRFRKHHLRPPLLGFFIENKNTDTEYNFVPILDTKPNRIPAERFVMPRSSSPYNHWNWNFLGCRHGLGVLIHYYGREVVVWDPLTGQQHRVPFPPALQKSEFSCTWHAAVLCADAEDGHVHGDCFFGPFKLVLVCAGRTKAFACMYESVSDVWGNIVSTWTTITDLWISPSILIGSELYWLFGTGDILAFGTDTQTLGQIKKPTVAYHTGWSFQLWRTNDDGGVGLAVLSKFGIHLWEWKMNCEGVFGWVLQPRIIKLEGIFPQSMCRDQKKAVMVGYDEESNVIVLATFIGDFMLNLESMRFRRISERNCWDNKIHYPYRNFYTAGRGVGWKWLDLKL